jgi:hypothetical protein
MYQTAPDISAVPNGRKTKAVRAVGKIRKEEFEQFIFSAMQEKFKDFQILHGREEKSIRN